MTEYNITTLSNGLRVISEFIPHVESVAVNVWVDVGSSHESKAESGISHFLEHMAFKGTKTRSAKDIAEQFDDIGGKVNAFTSLERTAYYAKVLKEDIDIAVEILSDILQNSIFDHQELERERGVILQEIAMTNDTPDDIIFDYFHSAAYPNQSIGRPIIGSKANVNRFTADDLSSYLKKHYSADKMVLAASGNIDHEKLIKLAEKWFADLNPQNTKQAIVLQPKYHGGYCAKQKKLEQTHLVLGFNGTSYGDLDRYYELQIAANILGGGMSSQLFQEIREKRGLAYSVYAYNSSYKTSGLFAFYAATSHDKVNELIVAISEEVLKAAASIKPQELNRTIKQIKAHLLMSKENISERARKLASNLLSFGYVLEDEDVLERINRITLSRVTDSISNVITSHATAAILGETRNLLCTDKIGQLFTQ